MTEFSIKDMADFSGVKQHTIRIWEKRFSFLQPKRNQTQRRSYSLDDLQQILNISLLIRSGMRIAVIAAMQEKERMEIISAITDVGLVQAKVINELVFCMAEMDTEHFEVILDSCVLYWGIHETLKKVIIPFTERIGLLGTPDSRINIENIQLIKHFIIQKIYSGIEKAISKVTSEEKVVLLFLPEGEKNEIQLLVIHYFIRVEGFHSIYVGKDLSTPKLRLISYFKKPNFIVTNIFEKNPYKQLAPFIRDLPRLLPKTKFICVGNNPFGKGFMPHFKHAGNIDGVLNYLK